MRNQNLGASLVTKRLSYAYVCLILLVSFCHLAIGSSPVLVLIFSAISLMGLFFLRQNGLYFGDVYVFVLSLYSGTNSLLAKLLLGQPLQSNLDAPLLSAFVLFIGFAACAMAAYFSRPKEGMWSGNRFFVGALNDPRLTSCMLPWVAVLGVGFYVLHIIFRPKLTGDTLQATEGFGGFGSFYFLIPLAVCIAARLGAKFGYRRGYFVLAVMVPVVLLLSVMANVKKNFFDLTYILAFSYLAFGLRFSRKIIAASVVLVMVAVLYISPVVHLMRADFSDQTLVERVESFFTILDNNNYNPSLLRDAEAKYMEGFTFSYNSKNSYIFPSDLNLDRFFLVKPLDRVVSYEGEDDASIGVGPFAKLVLQGILPSLFIEKSLYVGADLVGWNYGIVHIGSIGRPVIGFSASAYAAWGFLGVVVFPFLVIFPAFLFLNRFLGDYKDNVFAVLMFSLSSQLAEKEIDAFCVAMLREYAVVFAFIYVSIVFFRFVSSNRGSGA